MAIIDFIRVKVNEFMNTKFNKLSFKPPSAVSVEPKNKITD